jgi:hypothetical protein
VLFPAGWQFVYSCNILGLVMQVCLLCRFVSWDVQCWWMKTEPRHTNSNEHSHDHHTSTNSAENYAISNLKNEPIIATGCWNIISWMYGIVSKFLRIEAKQSCREATENRGCHLLVQENPCSINGRYRAQVIEKVTTNYEPRLGLKAIGAVKTNQSLKLFWNTIWTDERDTVHPTWESYEGLPTTWVRLERNSRPRVL